MLNEAEWSRCIAVLESVFGVQPETKHDLYFELLSDYTYEQLKAAVTRCARELRAYPTIRDIMDRIPGQMDSKSVASAAWMRVLHAATCDNSRYGDYNPNTGWTPNGYGLTPEEMAAAGGPRGLKSILYAAEDPSQLGYAERNFIDHYTAVVAQLAAGRNPAYLPPRHTSHEPRLIGDAVKDSERY